MCAHLLTCLTSFFADSLIDTASPRSNTSKSECFVCCQAWVLLRRARSKVKASSPGISVARSSVFSRKWLRTSWWSTRWFTSIFSSWPSVRYLAWCGVAIAPSIFLCARSCTRLWISWSLILSSGHSASFHLIALFTLFTQDSACWLLSGWYAVDLTCSTSFLCHHFAKSSDVNCETPSVMIFFILFYLANACMALMTSLVVPPFFMAARWRSPLFLSPKTAKDSPFLSNSAKSIVIILKGSPARSVGILF